MHIELSIQEESVERTDLMLAQNEKVIAAAALSAPEEVALDRTPNGVLVDNTNLTKILGLECGAALEDIIQIALLGPVRELTSNHGKRIRGQLVHLSCRLVFQGNPSVIAAKQCRTCAEVVELIHAGSLIVDDIEDGSRMRRGKPALHIRYGLPVALNAGNWLYFWPFVLLKTLELPSEATLSVYECYHQTLLRAHFGQAIDLGSRVDQLPQCSVVEVCRASMVLKTGALMGFAMVLGGAIGRATKETIFALDNFGRELGVALQMFDDLGNILGIREPSKRYEDLTLYRPSWAWASAAKTSSPNGYQQFISAVNQLPDARELEAWINQHNLIQTMREAARNQLESAYNCLREELESRHVRWSPRAFEELRKLGEEITVAYG
jgi:geranylgeranyl pyrophosphate synthase